LMERGCAGTKSLLWSLGTDRHVRLPALDSSHANWVKLCQLRERELWSLANDVCAAPFNMVLSAGSCTATSLKSQLLTR